MNKKNILMGFALLTIFATLSLGSAYLQGYGPYYANGNYDSYSSHTTRSQGNLYGWGSTKTTNYNRFNSEQILPDGTIEKTTQYVRTSRDSPNYPTYNNYNNQPNYQNYNSNYYPMQSNYNANYYNTNYPIYSNYNNYNSGYNNDYWYQKYWDNKNYPTYYARNMPMRYSGYMW